MSPSQSDKSLVTRRCLPMTSCGISSRFQLLSPSPGQVAHALLTRPPLSHTVLRRISSPYASFDLHVSGTPPAFVLSQDQTLNKSYLNSLPAAKNFSLNAYLSFNYFKEFYTCFHKFKALSLLVLKFCLSFITITSHVLQCLIFKAHLCPFLGDSFVNIACV